MSLRDIITKAQQEKKRAKTRDTAKKVGIGIGIGAALGSALGVLLAPKAGKETRADIARSTKKTVENIKDGAGEVGTKIQQVVTEGKNRIVRLRKESPAQIEAPDTIEVSSENETSSGENK